MKKKKFRKAVLAYIKSQMKPDEYAEAVGKEQLYALEQQLKEMNDAMNYLRRRNHDLWEDYRTRQR